MRALQDGHSFNTKPANKRVIFARVVAGIPWGVVAAALSNAMHIPDVATDAIGAMASPHFAAWLHPSDPDRDRYGK